jgi:hypothetical protein
MAYDDEDLFDEEFDFVDDDDDSEVEDAEVDEADSDSEEEEPVKPKRRSPRSSSSKGDSKRGPKKPAPAASEEVEEIDEEFATEVDEPDEAAVPTGPPLDHVVHIYEFGDFKRTIQREFTDEDSIKFAEEFNRTSKSYGRHAVPAERSEEPDPHL